MSNTPNRILVPTDLSETSAHALRYASRLAIRFDATLLVLHAVEAGDAEVAREELLTFAETNVPTQIAFEVDVVEDIAASAITSAAKSMRADLIVMGTHGRTGFRKFVLGSVTEAVMRSTSVPVLTIGSQTADTRISPAMPRIACYIDEPFSAKDVMDAAASVASDATEFVVLATADGKTLATISDELMHIRASMQPEVLRRSHITLIDGINISEEIVLESRAMRADAIAIATPSRHVPFDVLRGTTVERVVQQSFCPVLVINEAKRPVTASKPRLVYSA